MVAFGIAGLAALAAGIAVVLTIHSLLGPLLVVAGVLAVGRVAFAIGLTRIAEFLSTGSWRRE